MPMEIPSSDIPDTAFFQILRYHEFIFGDGYLDWCERATNFMVYDLRSQRESQQDIRAADILDDFFFKAKNFQIRDFAIPPKQALSEKSGPGLFLALLYCHLAETLDLQTQILNWPRHHVVRRSGDDKTVYVDLDRRGKIMSEDEIVSLLNENRHEYRLLTARESCIRYLRTVVKTLEGSGHFEFHHRTLNILLDAEPENTKWLAERALLRKKMGLLKEALQDMKRYFAFVDQQNAQKDLLDAYSELQSHI